MNSVFTPHTFTLKLLHWSGLICIPMLEESSSDRGGYSCFFFLSDNVDVTKLYRYRLNCMEKMC